MNIRWPLAFALLIQLSSGGWAEGSTDEVHLKLGRGSTQFVILGSVIAVSGHAGLKGDPKGAPSGRIDLASPRRPVCVRECSPH